MTALGRIQPFLPRGTFEAFGRTARDIGQTTPFRPMGGCSPPKVVTLGVERPPKLLTNPHFSPGALGSGAFQGFLARRLKLAPMLRFSVNTALPRMASFP